MGQIPFPSKQNKILGHRNKKDKMSDFFFIIGELALQFMYYQEQMEAKFKIEKQDKQYKESKEDVDDQMNVAEVEFEEKKELL